MKHSRNSSLSPLPRKRFLDNTLSYFSTILIASLLGTYLDLYFVGKNMYEFPIRPFSTIFSINIAFTMVGLPLLTWMFLFLMNRLNRWKRLVLIFTLSIMGPAIEKMSEEGGFFFHSEKWSHSYSFFGYFLFLIIIWFVFKWCNRGNKEPPFYHF
ncbi:CBO0543 family protein [Lederbergia citrea]|uniref:CBO0543 family protein n=1 Tax=Lederbergia citrea TaxID=2833581 RepID=UPI003211B6B9